MAMRSLPRAVATGLRTSDSRPLHGLDPVATAPGTDSIINQPITWAAASLGAENSGRTLKTSSAYFTFPKGAET
ncbi:MAG: hypothetical protein QOI77_2058 [Blastocatellia bacterium]|nr:hypothetical protein [Blastocatellia bacterium]